MNNEGQDFKSSVEDFLVNRSDSHNFLSESKIFQKDSEFYVKVRKTWTLGHKLKHLFYPNNKD